jgi:hypothetical protein
MAGGNTKAKTEFNKRLYAEGRWDEYFRYREGLVHDATQAGIPAKDIRRVAWKIAAQNFPPLDGSPHEIVLHGELEKFNGLMAGKVATPASLSEPPPKQPTILPVVKKIARKRFSFKTAPQKEEPPKEPPKEAEPEDVAPPPLPKLPSRGGGWTDYGDIAVNGLKDITKTWASLRAHVELARNASAMQVINWVFKNADSQPDEIDAASVPDRGALRLLRWVQASDNNYGDFMRTNWVKCIPDKRVLEWESNFADDGRKQLQMLEDFERTFGIDEELDQDLAASA